MRVVVGLIIVGMFLLAMAFRYEVVPGALGGTSSEAIPVVFELDRWTGLIIPSAAQTPVRNPNVFSYPVRPAPNAK